MVYFFASATERGRDRERQKETETATKNEKAPNQVTKRGSFEAESEFGSDASETHPAQPHIIRNKGILLVLLALVFFYYNF